MVLLSVNAGSSSLKVSVFDRSQLKTPRAAVSIEGIGTPDGAFIPAGAYGTDAVRKLPIDSMLDATELVKNWLDQELGIHSSDIEAIGHRVVHGGEKYKAAAALNDELLGYLSSIVPLAPNHMPGTLTALEAFVDTYPDSPQVACFDTSFFHDIPEVAQTLPIPLPLQRENSIRRYGFHGLSYEYLINNFRENEGDEAANGKVIICHLGSGASIAACKNGLPMDMSMGFTPVSGIMMSTRSGDIEPGVLSFLQKEKGMTIDEISELVTHKSGLLGVSGKTHDMYTLLQAQHEDPDAKLAIELFCYRIKKTIGSYAAVLGGIDSIIFSAGIGERSAEIRARVCDSFDFLGLEIDDERNKNGERKISSDNSKVNVHVIPTQEDFSIITQTMNVIDKGGN